MHLFTIGVEGDVGEGVFIVVKAVFFVSTVFAGVLVTVLGVVDGVFKGVGEERFSFFDALGPLSVWASCLGAVIEFTE